MSDFLFSVAPIFLIIVLGYLLRRGGIPNIDFWNLNDKLVYWVLMPAFLFHKMATIHLTFELVSSYATVILGGLGCAALFGIVSARVAGLANPAVSSVFQGAARHNTFIALAIAERIYGPDGLALAALVTAILIPVTNLTVVPVMVTLNRKAGEQGFITPILKDLGRNPLLISVGLGLAFNLSGVGIVPVLHETTRVIGGAALPIVLMCVGANLRLRAMQTGLLPVSLSIIGKMVVFPAAAVGLAMMLGLSEMETVIAVLFAAAPTASAAYTLARQLGGDAPLMAAIVAIQTGLSFFTIPLTVHAVEWFLRHGS